MVKAPGHYLVREPWGYMGTIHIAPILYDDHQTTQQHTSIKLNRSREREQTYNLPDILYEG